MKLLALSTTTSRAAFIWASRMECPPKPSVVLVPALIIFVLVAAVEPGTALKLQPTGTSSHVPPLLDCAPAPGGSNLSGAFRDDVLSLLGALPVSAATAPTGFAAAQCDHAFARAFCFGFGTRGGSSPDKCLDCLSAAARDVADRCHGRRGAVWRSGCFLSYADTNASTAHEDAFHGWFYDDYGDDTPTAALGSQCVANTTATECARCLNETVKGIPALKGGRRLSLLHGESQAVVVVGYSCYLRVPLFPPMPRWQNYVFGALGVFDAVAVVLIEVAGLLFCINNALELNPA